ncbi:MAG: ATP-binding cassette domain-containing protein, partial [Eubacteriales bacterium]
MGKILEVKNLKISFRTSGGILKAVRDISFDLEKGETLAIVGESGSGKSVTSKAILGILAGNSIIEGGEILFDGKDLLKIPETEMYKVRGDKISMIFQDPLSSLNPIVRIGKQITEAMILKNKTNRKEARESFNSLLAVLEKNIILATADDASVSEEKIKNYTKLFDTFNIESIKFENNYNNSYNTSEELKADIDELVFRVSKRQKLDIGGKIKEFSSKFEKINDPFFISGSENEISSLKNRLSHIRISADMKKSMTNPDGTPSGVLPSEISDIFNEITSLLSALLAHQRPDFFSIGYYKIKHPAEDITKIPVERLNAIASEYLEKDFLAEFVSLVERGVKYSYLDALEKKKKTLEALSSAKEYYAGKFTKNEAFARCRELSEIVESSIDRLEFIK